MVRQMEDSEDDLTDLLVESGQRFLKVVERGDLAEVEEFVKREQPPLFFEDPESGWSALHFAASIESPELLSYLLEEGVIWNAVDSLGNTAGDIAISLNNETCYNIIRDAGLRSEFILRALGNRIDEGSVLKTTDRTAVGSLETFLTTPLKFTRDENNQEVCMVETDSVEVGVMMGWELPIMQETAKRLYSEDHEDELSVLNVGFGLGIIDTLFQALPRTPSRHVIIEAHPDVLSHMRLTGWYDKPGVTVLEGKWQDHIESEALLSPGGFDIVYTDTFAEEYSELHNFFEQVPNLLKSPSSRFAWFNGLGATSGFSRHLPKISL
ncbi:Arginine N-methyltransferase 2 [Tulasnella sp. 403]|nr:Arginine N-methyltransferase 2 [Tulasnella sp. 403]